MSILDTLQKYKINLFLKSAGLFFITLFIGLVAGEELKKAYHPAAQINLGVTPWEFLAYFFVATALFWLVVKLFKSALIFRLIFVWVLFIGVSLVLEIVFPSWAAMALAFIFITGLFIQPYVWLHDIIIIIASAGIGALFGLQFGPDFVVLFMIILSIYDLISVYLTKHMVTLAHTMIEKKTIFALIVPEYSQDFFENLDHVKPASGFLILGSGDIILPMMLAVAAIPYGHGTTFMIIIGALLGLAANHWLLMRWPKPMPALPLIALGSLSFFLIALITRI